MDVAVEESGKDIQLGGHVIERAHDDAGISRLLYVWGIGSVRVCG